MPGLIVVVALLVYVAWQAIERSRENRGATVLAATRELGDDAVPASLHPIIAPQLCMGSGACVTACPEKEVIAVVRGRMALINPLGCVGHGECADACPTDAITLVYGNARRGVELPRLGPTFETTLPGVYIVGELGGMGLIRNAIKQGSEVAATIAGNGRRAVDRDALDAIVVGAGPAGISATLGLKGQGISTLLLERESMGGAIMHYPRAKVVMTGTLDIPGYPKIARRTMQKEELVALWQDIHATTGLPVIEGELVEGLQPDGRGGWLVQTNQTTRRAANVVLALGRRGTPRKLGVPGEEQGKVVYSVIEPEVFRGQHVLVVGGGNSAVENAIALNDQGSCASVTISYRRAAFARCRGDNRARIEEAIRLGQIRPAMATEVTEIGPDGVVLRDKDGRLGSLRNDAVVVQIGGTPPGKILADFGIDVVTKHGEY